MLAQDTCALRPLCRGRVLVSSGASSTEQEVIFYLFRPLEMSPGWTPDDVCGALPPAKCLGRVSRNVGLFVNDVSCWGGGFLAVCRRDGVETRYSLPHLVVALLVLLAARRFFTPAVAVERHHRRRSPQLQLGLWTDVAHADGTRLERGREARLPHLDLHASLSRHFATQY